MPAAEGGHPHAATLPCYRGAAVLHHQRQGVLPHEGRARVHPHPLRRSGGTGCETQGEGSPESGKAQEKGAVPVRMTFF